MATPAPARTELHQQLVAVLAEHRVSLQPLADGGVHLSVTEHDQVADQLLVAVDAYVAAACARAAAGALREAATYFDRGSTVGAIRLHVVGGLRKRAAALSAPRTTEGDPT